MRPTSSRGHGVPDHDSYWHFHRDLFLELVPPPGRRTLDLGCGEGRLSRDLKALGHDVVGVDRSPAMLAAATRGRRRDRDAPRRRGGPAVRATRRSTSSSRSCRCQDIEDFEGAIREAARVLRAGRPLLPCRSSTRSTRPARSQAHEADSPFTITGSYSRPHYYADEHRARRARAHARQRPPPPAGVHGGRSRTPACLIERLRELGRAGPRTVRSRTAAAGSGYRSSCTCVQ